GQGGNVMDLGDLGRPGISAHAINDAGQIVGGSHNFESRVHAFLWELGIMRDLGSLGQFSVAYDVNETGAAVGQTDVGNGELHAALWPSSLPVPTRSSWKPRLWRARPTLATTRSRPAR